MGSSSGDLTIIMDKSLLKRALEDTEEPTPGYMFRDIAQWTFIDHNTQNKLIVYLMDKMKPTTSVHVLAKTLKVIKVLCETGHADFQKEMQRRNDDLKQFASYRGKPDAKFGDKLNEKVRQTAREAIDAAFTHRKETKVQVLGGHGSDTTFEEKKSVFTTGSTVSASDSAPLGANARIAAMPTGNKWAEHMAQMASGNVTAPGAQAGVVQSFVDAAKTGFGFWHENVKTQEQRMMESMSNGSEFRPVELGFGAPGGGFGGAGNGSSGASSWKFTEEGTSGGGSSLLPKEETKILTPFQVEVEKICAFKNTPQRVDLSNFVNSIEQIGLSRGGDLEELAQNLDERLQQKYTWQQRLNSMAAIEAVIRHTQSSECQCEGESFTAYFKENPEDVQRNVHVVQASLKEKAQKVLKMLGVPERASNQVETSSAQQITVATSGGGLSWASASAPVSSQAEEDSTTGDLLGGMTVKTRGSKAAEKEEKDKTKLKKRAAMVVEDDPPPQAQQQPRAAPASQQGFGGGNDQWGSWGATDSGASSSWTFDAPAQPTPVVQAQQPAPVAVQSQPPQKKDFLDDFFGAPPAGSTQTAWSTNQLAAPPVPQQYAPAPVAAPPVTQAPVNVAPAAPALSAQSIMQMQQQMQQLMLQINMSDPNALAQMQALMAQQQQLMALLASTQQVAPSQPSVTQAPVTPLAPHGHFQVQLPPKSQPQQNNDSFAAVQQEMMSKLLQKQ